MTTQTFLATEMELLLQAKKTYEGALKKFQEGATTVEAASEYIKAYRDFSRIVREHGFSFAATTGGLYVSDAFEHCVREYHHTQRT